jgi:RHH-type proline utilization regulon transcriptional repressor/proline dehydrogenase/delta 1-pyrroline-5-carboxylate dehydrogenase
MASYPVAGDLEAGDGVAEDAAAGHAGGAGPGTGEDVRPGLRAAITRATLEDEQIAVERLVDEARLAPELRRRVEGRAARLVTDLRRVQTASPGPLDGFLKEFGLSDREGVALMSLAEALLRIPDADTANRLIRDKIGGADWLRHLGHGTGSLVSASIRALALTGRVIGHDGDEARREQPWFDRVITRLGEPVARQAMVQAMRILGGQFVLGRTVAEALERGRDLEQAGYALSYDLLGEAARTGADALRHLERILAALDAVGGARGGGAPPGPAPGLSVKLSALHPRLEWSQRERVRRELLPRLRSLALKARFHGLGLTVDAEEASRLDLTLDLVEAIQLDPGLAGWDGFGLAVQAYQKRAPAVIDWLAALARLSGRRLAVRLVKGAYWDSEIKRTQERGLSGYPVFTRKVATDTAYIACARRLLERRDLFYPQFATHNAHTLAAVIELAGGAGGYEFQRLHGMGEALYRQLAGSGGPPCRVYAPVGSTEELLPYLMRRLLENGASSSFVNRVFDPEVPVAVVVADPVERVASLPAKPHPGIPLPVDLYQPERCNSLGADLSDPVATATLLERLEAASQVQRHAGPIIAGRPALGPDHGRAHPVYDPADHRRRVGTLVEATVAEIEPALAVAARAAAEWASVPVERRAAILDRAAALLARDRIELMALLLREAGKTIPDALAEVREAEDYCRYYAARARADLARPVTLRGPTGEVNRLSLHGRGVFVCISPWNFPLAIFLGQITAALVAGNPVVAKPAEQTPLIAARAVHLLLEAGVPAEAIQLLPGPGASVGARLVTDARVAGVAFTGSFEVARAINRTLAARSGPIVPLIAETGGINAMIVDSSALPEQVVDDVVASAFGSAGQRCSALRLLLLQEEIADRVIDMLAGAAGELVVGDPGRLDTDIGPVIDDAARAGLMAHIRRLRDFGPPLFQAPLGPGCEHGSFVAPLAFPLDRVDRLDQEVFGPLLHVVRYQADRLDGVLEAIRALRYGLTLGVHSRIEHTQTHICERLPAGNRYVNRSMVGAVVGVQPFGGEGLSGTGPKAGGPHTLLRYVTERTLSVNTAAVGNVALISLDDGCG